ncbi:MAG: hypothetical protein MZV65_38960 [Chromatiales bacterium]|nr:hypothetical protein [Chromatiales bacterium]
MRDIHIEFVTDAFVAAVDGSWIDGRFDSEDTARKAAEIDPDRLNALWKTSLATGREGLITAEDLQ